MPLMACQIMFWQAQTKIDRLLASFGRSISISKQIEKIDLSHMILKTWRFGATTNLKIRSPTLAKHIILLYYHLNRKEDIEGISL